LPSSLRRPRHWPPAPAIPALGPSHQRHLLPALLVEGELRGQSAAVECSRVCPPYVVVYGSGLTRGLLLCETMDVSERPGGDVLDFVVGCSIFSTHQPPAGVAGPASLPSQLGLRRFSYCLISRIYDDQEGAMGDVVLEGAAESSWDGLSFTPFLRNPAATAGSPFSVYYYLGLRRITVDGAKVRIPHAALLPLPSGDGGTIIDSGTTITYMEPRVFEPVAAAAAGRYNRSEVLEQLTGLRPCFRLAGAGNRLPQLTFHWKGGAKMKFKTLFMSSSKRAPQRDGKAPASPSPPAPPALPFPETYSPDYWNGFYVGWTMALQKASRLYHHKGLTNILPDIGPRAEQICSSPSSRPSPARSYSSPPASTE
ncbi:hypothetical protein Taro_042927, partial [Colocasia esculenta]|nr:hypothetical protein [Colocasia esculenta]